MTLTTSADPAHTHTAPATQRRGDAGALRRATCSRSSPPAPSTLYRRAADDSALTPASIAPTGGSQPHDNIQPYLCVNFIISLFGIFPSQN